MTDFSEALITQLLKQQKLDRRWRNIRFFGWVIMILLVVVIYMGSVRFIMGTDALTPKTPYISLVRMTGMIMPDKSFSAENMLPALHDAFSDKESKGVIIDIDSGGGSPVQSSIIYDTIVRFKNKYHKKVMIVGEDMMASGAYMVAMAGDQVFVNPNTITGSIGVVTQGFGFVGLMDKVGVSRRLFTSGKSKARLDPFEPMKPEDVDKIKSVLTQVHEYFIGIVKQSRGKRLQGDPNELFSGDFWTGTKAKSLGLVDGFGDIETVMQTEFHVTHCRDYTPQPPLLQALMGNMGTALHDLGLGAKQELLMT